MKVLFGMFVLVAVLYGEGETKGERGKEEEYMVIERQAVILHKSGVMSGMLFL